MNHTEVKMVKAFWQLLEEKAYSSITVKDVVSRCGLNRNTFYYHFQDMPSLFETALKEWVDKAIGDYCRFGEPIDCIIPIVEECTRHKRAFLHAYRSIEREKFQDGIDRLAFYTVSSYVETATEGLHVPPEDKSVAIHFFKCALVGIVLDWLKDGMKYDLVVSSRKFFDLFGDIGTQAFLKHLGDGADVKRQLPRHGK